MKLLIEGDAIAARVGQMADALVAETDSCPVVVGVLNGALLFTSDLVRAMAIDVEVDFLALEPFAPDSGRARLTKDLDIPVTGRDVILVEDVVDTGLKLQLLLRYLAAREPARVRVVTLLDRRARRLVPVPLDQVGFPLEHEFAVGYGLGFDGRFRNLRSLQAFEPAD